MVAESSLGILTFNERHSVCYLAIVKFNDLDSVTFLSNCYFIRNSVYYYILELSGGLPTCISAVTVVYRQI